jgi:hypothetical protein
VWLGSCEIDYPSAPKSTIHMRNKYLY